MRTLRLAFWALVAVLLVTVGLANRGIVRLRVLPEALGEAVGVSPDLDLPLFLVVFAGAAGGFLLGFVWEWIREVPERAHARAQAREMERLRREVAELRGPAARAMAYPGARADVLAAVDAPPLPRR